MGQKLLENCPVKLVDVTNVMAICGAKLAGMYDRTVQRKPDRVETDGVVSNLRNFYSIHKVCNIDSICDVHKWDFISDYLIPLHNSFS